MVSTWRITAGLVANRNQSGYGTLRTHWRMGRFGKTLSTRCAALSTMRRAPATLRSKCRLAGICKANAEKQGTESAPLATERYKFLVMAGLAANAQEPVFQAAALEVILELLNHISRKLPALPGQHRLKGRPVLLDELVEQRRLRSAAFVLKRADGPEGILIVDDGHAGRSSRNFSPALTSPAVKGSSVDCNCCEFLQIEFVSQRCDASLRLQPERQ